MQPQTRVLRHASRSMQPVVVSAPVSCCRVRRHFGNGSAQKSDRRIDHHLVDTGPIHRLRVSLWREPFASEFQIGLLMTRQN
jgi:hypothetical protein